MAYIIGEATVQQYFDANGPLANGTIEFYLTGTSTPTEIYSDSAGTSQGTSVSLNAIGAPQSSAGVAIALFFNDAITYKIIRKDASGTAVPPTIDPYTVPAGGNAYIPLAGNPPPAGPVTGLIYFENVSIDKEFVLGIQEGLVDDFIISAQGDNVANASIYLNVDLSSWQFQASGEVLMPDVDYSTFSDLAAVTKEYVDNTAASGVPANTYLELSGTNPTYPMVGDIDYDLGGDQQWTFGNILGGVGYTYTGSGSSAWGVWYGGSIALGVASDGNITTNPSFDCAADGDPETLTPKAYVDDLTDARPSARNDGATMAWGMSNGSGTLQSGSSGVASVVKQAGLGHYRVTFQDTAGGTGRRAVTANPEGVLNPAIGCQCAYVSTTVWDIYTVDDTATLVNAPFVFISITH